MTDSAEANKNEILNEIATVQRDITYPAFGGVLNHQDDTLITRGGGRGLKIYDDIERDCTAYGDLQKRKQAVVSRPWQVDPASTSRIDKKAADIVKAQLGSVTMDFDNVCLNLLDAILKGYAVGELMWEVNGGELVMREIRPRNQRRFGFDDKYALRLKTQENMFPGIELPDRKFIVHTFGSKDGNPYGMGLGSRLFWPVFFKRKGITFWLTFADKFGSPTAVGKYPGGSSLSDQKKLLDALNAIAQDAGVIVPSGMEVALLEATRGGATDTYEKLCRYMDEQITMAVLGESPTSRGSGGMAASAAVTRNEVRLELVQADTDLLSGTLNKTVVKWITELNVPGAKPPKVWRKVEEQKNLGEVATRDKTIFDMGYRPTLAYIKETYGGDWTERPLTPTTPTNPISAAQTGIDATNFAAFAEANNIPADLAGLVASGLADQQAIKDAAAKFAEQYQSLLGGRIAELLAMLEESGDLVTFRERLAELLKQEPPQELTDSLTNAGFSANLAGAVQ